MTVTDKYPLNMCVMPGLINMKKIESQKCILEGSHTLCARISHKDTGWWNMQYNYLSLLLVGAMAASEGDLLVELNFLSDLCATKLHMAADKMNMQLKLKEIH